MPRMQRHSLIALSSAALLLALGGCDRPVENAADSATRARSRTEQAANDIRRGAERAADNTRAMGAAAASKVDDATITTRVNAALAADKDLSAIKIDVDTQNGVVTLSGPAPSAAAKAHASEIAHSVKGVTSVNNQLTIKAG